MHTMRHLAAITPTPIGYINARPIPPICGGSGEDDPKTFSQEDLDRIVGERLARERSNAPKVPDDYEDLKAKAARLTELEAAGQSDLDKANARAEQAEAKAQQAETKAAEAESRATAAQRRQSVIEAASAPIKVGEQEHRFVDPTVLPMFIPDDVDITDPAAVSTALAKVLTNRPYLAATGRTGVPNFEAGPRGNAPSKQGGDAGQAEADRRFGTSEAK